MAESKEYTTIVNQRSKLEIALHADRRVANYLRGESFITTDVFTEIMTKRSDSQRANLLVTEILKIVEQDPKNYYKLLNCLHHWGNKYKAIYETLNEEYSKVESLQETVPKSETTPTVITSSSLPDSGILAIITS